MNKTYLLKQAPRQDNHPSPTHMMLTCQQGTWATPCQVLGYFVSPRQSHPTDNNPSGSEDDSNQNHNETTVFNGQPQQKSTGTGTGLDQPSNTGMQNISSTYRNHWSYTNIT